MKKSLELRKSIKSKKPGFAMQNSGRLKRLDNKWRKPKGIDSKMRLKYAKRKMVSPGYGSPKDVKGLDSLGLEPVLVHNIADLEKLEKNQTVVIASSVGKRKKINIVEACAEKKLTISNLKNPDEF